MGAQKIRNDDFDYFRRVIEERSGISLSPAKSQLVESRLRRRLD